MNTAPARAQQHSGPSLRRFQSSINSSMLRCLIPSIFRGEENHVCVDVLIVIQYIHGSRSTSLGGVQVSSSESKESFECRTDFAMQSSAERSHCPTLVFAALFLLLASIACFTLLSFVRSFAIDAADSLPPASCRGFILQSRVM